MDLKPIPDKHDTNDKVFNIFIASGKQTGSEVESTFEIVKHPVIGVNSCFFRKRIQSFFPRGKGQARRSLLSEEIRNLRPPNSIKAAGGLTAYFTEIHPGYATCHMSRLHLKCGLENLQVDHFGKNINSWLEVA